MQCHVSALLVIVMRGDVPVVGGLTVSVLSVRYTPWGLTLLSCHSLLSQNGSCPRVSNGKDCIPLQCIAEYAKATTNGGDNHRYGGNNMATKPS